MRLEGEDEESEGGKTLRQMGWMTHSSDGLDSNLISVSVSFRRKILSNPFNLIPIKDLNY